MIEREKFDIIITDYNMPTISGKDIIDQGLKHNVSKIILISGENPNIEKYSSSVIFYPKPIAIGNFIEDITNCLLSITI